VINIIQKLLEVIYNTIYIIYVYIRRENGEGYAFERVAELHYRRENRKGEEDKI
jgi:hypothetical protein